MALIWIDVMNFFLICRDVTGAMNRLEFDQIVRMEEVLQQIPQTVTIMEASARDGKGLQDIAKWIQEHARPPPY